MAAPPPDKMDIDAVGEIDKRRKNSQKSFRDIAAEQFERNERLQEENKRVKATNERKVTALKAELDTLKIVQKGDEQESLRQHVKIKQLEQQVKNLKSDLEFARKPGDKDKPEKLIKEMESRLDFQREKAEHEKKQAHNNAAQLHRDIEALKGRADAAEKDRNAKAQKILELDDQNLKLQRICDDTEKRNQELLTENDRLENEQSMNIDLRPAQDLQVELTNLKSDLTARTNEVEALKLLRFAEDPTESDENHQMEIITLKSELTDRDTRIACLKDDKEYFIETVEDLKHQKAYLNTQIENKNRDIENKNREIENKNQEIENKNQEIETYQAQEAGLHEDYFGVKADFDTIMQELEDCKAQATAELQAKDRQFEEFKAQVDAEIQSKVAGNINDAVVAKSVYDDKVRELEDCKAQANAELQAKATEHENYKTQATTEFQSKVNEYEEKLKVVAIRDRNGNFW